MYPKQNEHPMTKKPKTASDLLALSGLSQDEASEALGISQGYLSRILHGRKYAAAETILAGLDKLCAVPPGTAAAIAKANGERRRAKINRRLSQVTIDIQPIERYTEAEV